LANRELEEIVFNSAMGVNAQLGQISNDELWSWVGKHLYLNSSQIKQFHFDFWSGDVLDRQLIDFIGKIQPFYQLAIISNATDALRKSLEKKYEIARLFDPIVISAEEKIMKPDREIYERTLTRLELHPNETIFIDDSQPNVQAAQDIGMKAIHFQSTSELIASVSELDREGESDEHN
jgi:FMN phosphatase YigB (HAD superfamily)